MPRGFTGHDDGIVIDASALSALARDLRDTDRELRKSLLRRVRAAANPARDAVRREAAFSTRIPGAVGVRSSYAAKGAKIRVVVDARKAPHARPINNRDRSGTFRHPVYGNRDVWVAQQADPFMARAASRVGPEVFRGIAKVYDDIAREAGFTH